MRLREYSERIPKPLAEIGPRPIVWHLMKYYAHFGHKDFILCLGYAGQAIKRYFLEYNECMSNDFTMSDGGATVKLERTDISDWNITFADTGATANLGERLLRVKDYLEGEEMFMANYADGLADLDLNRYVDSFRKRDKIACFLSVKVPQAFHIVTADAEGYVQKLEPVTESSVRINGGFFVFKQELFDYLKPGEELVLEPFERLARKRQLLAVPNTGFWHCMDTFKDKMLLDELASRQPAPWEVWSR